MTFLPELLFSHFDANVCISIKQAGDKRVDRNIACPSACQTVSALQQTVFACGVGKSRGQDHLVSQTKDYVKIFNSYILFPLNTEGC
jgi:hypothetical protein